MKASEKVRGFLGGHMLAAGKDATWWKCADSEEDIPDIGTPAKEIPGGILLPERRPPARRHR